VSRIAGLVACVLGAVSALGAPAPRPYVVPSPTHGQTYAFGSERNQQWLARGPDHHLALAAEFTNDPYVDRINPREYDDFTFDFPDIRLGRDGRTFYYHASNGRLVPVAQRHSGFLGLQDISLLPGSLLLVEKPHGYLSLSLLIGAGRETDTASL
jgi:hypothetical protein